MIGPDGVDRRTTNIGSVVLHETDDDCFYLSVQNEYTVEPDTTGGSNVRNTLEVHSDDGTKAVSVPLTQQDCFQLAMMFLRVYADDRSWREMWVR